MASNVEKLPFWLEAEGVKWQHKDDYNSWKDYKADIGKKCENAYRKLQTGDSSQSVFEYTADNGNTIKVDIKNLQQRNTSGYYGYRRQVRRLGPTLPKPVSASSLERTFRKYQDQDDPNSIGFEGMMSLFGDIGVDMDANDGAGGIGAFVVPLLMPAASMEKYTKDEFCGGFAKVGCSSFRDMKNLFNQVRQKVNTDNKVLKFFYRNLFPILCEEKKRSVDKDTALSVWDVVLQTRPVPLYKGKKGFRAFFEQTEDYPVITKDPWNSIGDFLLNTMRITDFTDDGSWPLIIDDFVEWSSSQ